ncbi:hypothetical protein DFH09DRAFT_452883 [Mycena vulgaris]|nr:hypothetical protein DFH09DRAFT_452883 [Mycena vulgaris]
MARIILSLVSLLCLFQALAAPLNQRAVASNPDCNKANGQLGGGLLSARVFLASINAVNDVVDPLPFLTAQIALLNVSTVSNKLALSLLSNEPPTPDNTQALILSGLKAAETVLSGVALVNTQSNGTAAVNLARANSFLAEAIVNAQQAVDLNCTTVAVAPTAVTAVEGATSTRVFGTPYDTR